MARNRPLADEERRDLTLAAAGVALVGEVRTARGNGSGLPVGGAPATVVPPQPTIDSADPAAGDGTEPGEPVDAPAAAAPVGADDATSGQRFVGHAAVFDQRTAIGNPLKWGWYEQVSAGAFTKTLQEGDARFLIDHDSYFVVARVSADTLRLAQDKVGLAVDSDLDGDLSYVRDLVANVTNRNITGMSFGFYVVKDEWTTESVSTSDGQEVEIELRTIQEVRLLEVSAVTFPAYEQTDAGVRSSVASVLRRRGDVDAVARRAQYLPELRELLAEMKTSEPGESTRSTTAGDPAEPAPAATRHAPSPDAFRRARARVHRTRLASTA